MAETVFFDKRRKGNERKITLQNVLLLVGKAPTKSKRIKIRIQMLISGQKMTGVPEWLVNAYDFVAKNHDTVTPDVKFNGFDINFSTQQLFGEQSVNAVKCQMKSFVVSEIGDSENPDVALSFLVYSSFSTGLWNWLGQMGGEEVWAKFVQTEEAESESLELVSESNQDADDDPSEDDGDELEGSE